MPLAASVTVTPRVCCTAVTSSPSWMGSGVAVGSDVGDAVGSGVAAALGAELLTDELFAAAFTAVRAMPAPVPTTRIMAQLRASIAL